MQSNTFTLGVGGVKPKDTHKITEGSPKQDGLNKRKRPASSMDEDDTMKKYATDHLKPANEATAGSGTENIKISQGFSNQDDQNQVNQPESSRNVGDIGDNLTNAQLNSVEEGSADVETSSGPDRKRRRLERRAARAALRGLKREERKERKDAIRREKRQRRRHKRWMEFLDIRLRVLGEEYDIFDPPDPTSTDEELLDEHDYKDEIEDSDDTEADSTEEEMNRDSEEDAEEEDAEEELDSDPQ